MSYEQQSASANENGAWHNETSSSTDGDGDGSFNQESVTANENGVTSSETSAGTDDASSEDNEGAC